VEELYVVVYQRSNITNNTIGVSFARVVLIERKGKFKVNLVHFVAEVKGIEARGHKGKVAVKSLGKKTRCVTTIIIQHTSPINLDH